MKPSQIQSWLTLTTKNMKSCRKFCRLFDDFLEIHDSDQSNNPEETVKLSSINDIIDISDGSNFSFAILTDSNIYCFTSSTLNELEIWLNSLNNNNPLSHRASLKDFHIISFLGKGYSGKVMLAKYKETEKLVALKIISKEKTLDNVAIKHALAERNILKKLCSPFITKLYSSFQTSTNLYFALEFVPGGDLGSHLANGKVFSHKQVKIYLAEIAVALSYLHKYGIIFRDLKPSNILIDSTGHLKLTDFGLAKYLLIEEQTTSLCGTHEYLAPEMIKRLSYNFAVDWWSFGVLAYQLNEGVLPFESPNLNRLYDRIAKAPLRFWKPLPNDTKSFIQSLLQKDPSKRLGCGPAGEDEIFKHPYFSDIDWDKIMKKQYQMEFIPQHFTETKEEMLSDNECEDIYNMMFCQNSFNSETHIPGFSYFGDEIEFDNIAILC